MPIRQIVCTIFNVLKVKLGKVLKMITALKQFLKRGIILLHAAHINFALSMIGLYYVALDTLHLVILVYSPSTECSEFKLPI